MKLYYVAHCRFPSPRAHAIQIAKMAESFALTSVDLELILPRRNNSISQSPREFYGLKTDLPIRYLPVLNLYAWGRIGYVLGGLSFLISYMFFLLRKRMCKEKFILYTIDMDEFSFIGISFFLVPFIIEIHGSKKYGVLLSRMFKRAQAILTINNLIKDDLVQNFRIPEERILVHPNGIDLDLFSKSESREAWRLKWNIPINSHVALYVGKCYDWKGMEILHDAFRALPDVTFVFVGCTKEEFERVTKSHVGMPNAIFFGERPYIEMPLWMKSADVLLVLGTKKNAYSYTQTSPMKLFEYMASGVPVLSPNTPALRAHVSEREVVFYEPDSSESFIRGIRNVIGNRSVKELTVHAREATKQFSWEHRAKQILARFPQQYVHERNS
ncbi:MAG: glycosyltransferase family 4 protein [Patescibacteria group bacterium]